MRELCNSSLIPAEREKFMRVLVGGFSGHLCGGIETFLLNMNDRMSKECIYDYIIPGDMCIHSERIGKKGGAVFHIPPIKKNPFAHIGGYIKIFKERREKSDIFYYNMHSAANFLPPIIALCCGYKVILHSHNNGLQNANRLYKAVHDFGKLLLSGKKYIRWTNSVESAEFMFGKNKNAELIYNGIEVEKFRFDEEKRKELRSETGDSEKTIYGFAGRLEFQKNPEFLLETFSIIEKHDKNAVLWIIGEGSHREGLDALANKLGICDKVKFLGFRKNLNEYFSAMDMFLLPSRFEGLGIVLVEAQSSGLGCVTAKGCVPEIVNVTGNVLYLPLEKGKEFWGKQCAAAAQNKINRKEAYALVQNSAFNIETEAKRIESLLKSISSID